MKTIKLYTILALFLSLTIGVSQAFTTERHITYEMGESGNPITFEMTPEEIAERDIARARARARAEKARKRQLNEPEVWIEKIELPESGIELEFPMSDKQIRLAKERKAQERIMKKALETSQANAPCLITETIEMTDGKTIDFTNLC
jgi:hypothetical protein